MRTNLKSQTYSTDEVWGTPCDARPFLSRGTRASADREKSCGFPKLECQPSPPVTLLRAGAPRCPCLLGVPWPEVALALGDRGEWLARFWGVAHSQLPFPPSVWERKALLSGQQQQLEPSVQPARPGRLSAAQPGSSRRPQVPGAERWGPRPRVSQSGQKACSLPPLPHPGPPPHQIPNPEGPGVRQNGEAPRKQQAGPVQRGKLAPVLRVLAERLGCKSVSLSRS